MSILEALFGKKEPPRVLIEPDVVWMTKDAKFKGIEKHLHDDSIHQSIAVLLVAHCRGSQTLLNQIASRFEGDVPVMALMASDLSPDVATDLRISELKLIELIIAERHPLTYIDDQVVSSFASLLDCRCRATHHVSFEDDLMKVFAGDFVLDKMREMGMKDDEPIVSKMVSKRIRKAQVMVTKGIQAANATKELEVKVREGEWLEALPDF